ncbi:HTTM domain-containing protein [Flavivirga aquimarina]|uniref:HTTM domain-containing protein n=1 Tax=Flavivirga aquimarina TaxID=2027862 RepID=A0ABT8WDR4_9FLAO|nr:HTTM domain-containing protein [Flavivirga aquimarina]MDO5971183.1 HTTM domain-containing protein [Flavivirga aquimarina]
MCKLVFLLLVFHGFYAIINDPYIPFISYLDKFNDFPNVYKNTLRTLFFTSGIFMLFNFKVRYMSFVLGLTIAFVLLASKPNFANHYFICACILILASLIDKKQTPWLLFMQISILYFGAAINKMLQVDWWNGQFMHNWLANARETHVYIYMSDLLPEMWLAKLLSWVAMLVEISIAVLVLFKKKHRLVTWMILLFHTFLYTLTAFRFGHFYEDILIILLIFINHIPGIIRVSFNKLKEPFVTKLFSFLNFNDTFSFENRVLKNNKWLEVEIKNTTVSNWDALRLFLLYNTNFYIFLFLLDLLIRYLFNGFLMNFIHISLIWITILFFLPLLLKKRKGQLI